MMTRSDQAVSASVSVRTTGVVTVDRGARRIIYHDGSDRWEFSLFGHDADRLPVDGTAAMRLALGEGRAAVFVGHLYNREALAERLHRGREITAPELVLQGYTTYGPDFVSHLRGTYALIVYDALADRVVCTRDHVGFYPLFYSRSGDRWYFAQEIDLLLRQPGPAGTIHRAAVADTLMNRRLRSTETYYEAIEHLPLGNRLVIQHGTPTVEPYWDPAPPGTPDDRLTEVDLEQFDRHLDQAVERALSFGRAAIFLSGGLDSVSIAAAAIDGSRRRGDAEPMALSIAFPHPDCNEEEVQRGIAEGLGIAQTVVPFAEVVGPRGLIRATLDLASVWPAPIQNPWRPAYYALADLAARRDCQVVLTGGGGDDWLTVNSDYMADLLAAGDLAGSYRLYRSMAMSYNLPRGAMTRFLFWNSGLRPLVRRLGLETGSRVAPEALDSFRRRRLNRHQKVPDWIAPDPALRRMLFERKVHLHEAQLQQPQPSGAYGFYRHSAVSRTYAHQAISMEQEEDYEVGRRLGLRVIHPYWDVDLIEFLCKVPPRLLLLHGREKDIVRSTIARRFPDLGFARKKKVTASNFFASTLLTEGAQAWKDLGDAHALADLGVVDPAALDALVAECLSTSDLRVAHVLWMLLSLEVWVRSHG